MYSNFKGRQIDKSKKNHRKNIWKIPIFTAIALDFFLYSHLCTFVLFYDFLIIPFLRLLIIYLCIYISIERKKNILRSAKATKKKECLPLTSLMRRCLWIFHFLLSFHNNRKEQQQTQIRTHIHFGGRNQSSFNLYLFRFAIAFCTHSCSDFLERWK